MKEQIVVLRIRYDPQEDTTLIAKSEAATWDWADLAGEEVEVIAAGPEKEVD